MRLSQHAIGRCNSRGIPDVMIDLVLTYGISEHHRGAEILRLDKRGQRRAEKYLGSLFKGSKSMLRDIYIILKDEVVITAARKNKHHKRNRK